MQKRADRAAAAAVAAVLAISSLGVDLAAQDLAARGGETRVALVIGNGGYAELPLRNPPADAKDMAATLERLGFQVTVLVDADLAAMNRALRDFGNAIRRPDAVALFYYSGHGVQYRGANYLIPAAADIQTADEIPYSALNAEQVYAKMESSGDQTNIVILDACRNNPFLGADRAADRGLAVVGAVQPPQSIIIYSTAPGRTASDGEGRNGVFTEALLRNIALPDIDIEMMMRRVRDEVMRASAGAQVPWQNSSLSGEGFAFVKGAAQAKPPQQVPVPAVAPVSTPRIDLPFRTVKVDGSPDDWEGIGPAFQSGGEDQSPPVPLLGIDAIYHCRDEKYLYALYRLKGAKSKFSPPKTMIYEEEIGLGTEDVLLLSCYWGLEDSLAEARVARWKSGTWTELAEGWLSAGVACVEARFPLSTIAATTQVSAVYSMRAKVGYRGAGDQWPQFFMKTEPSILGSAFSKQAVAAIGRSSSASPAPEAGGKAPYFFTVDPLGFLLLGPGVQFGVPLSSGLYVVPHARWAYLGTLYKEIVKATTDGSSALTPACFAIGASLEGLGKPGASGNKWYYGGSLEFFQTDQDINLGLWDARHAVTRTFVVMGEFGYRWGGGARPFFIALGAQGGYGLTLSSDWWYLSDPGSVRESGSGGGITAMLQLRLGWEIGTR